MGAWFEGVATDSEGRRARAAGVDGVALRQAQDRLTMNGRRWRWQQAEEGWEQAQEGFEREEQKRGGGHLEIGLRGLLG